MAAVYKSLSKKESKKPEAPTKNGAPRNKQRVLILSSRGVTYRFVLQTANLL
jgi:ribosome biogenesis protein BRX1